jgi:hypothetical protein
MHSISLRHNIIHKEVEKTAQRGFLWFLLFNQYYSGDPIMKCEMGGAGNTVGMRRGVYGVLVRKPEGKQVDWKT